MILGEEEKKSFVYNVVVPTQEEMEAALLEKQKQELLAELGNY